VVLVGLWLGVLTLAVLLCIRQIALMMVRLDLAKEVVSLGDDGLDIGLRIPEEVLEDLPGLLSGRTYLVLLSANCAPCRELVPGLSAYTFDEPILTLVPGREELAADLEATLPSWTRAIRDPVASRVAEGLHIESTPFAMQVDDGTVTGKAYLREASDLAALILHNAAPAEPDENRAVSQVQEVSIDGS
jgi:hypothetical protein